MQPPGWPTAKGTSTRTARFPSCPPTLSGEPVLQATLGHAGGITFAGHGGRARGPVARGSPAPPALSAICSAGGSTSAGLPSSPAATPFARADNVEGYAQAIASTFPIDTDTTGRRGRITLDCETSLAGIQAFLDDFSPPAPAGPTGGDCTISASAASAWGWSPVLPRSARYTARAGTTTNYIRSSSR